MTTLLTREVVQTAWFLEAISGLESLNMKGCTNRVGVGEAYSYRLGKEQHV